MYCESKSYKIMLIQSTEFSSHFATISPKQKNGKSSPALETLNWLRSLLNDFADFIAK